MFVRSSSLGFVAALALGCAAAQATPPQSSPVYGELPADLTPVPVTRSSVDEPDEVAVGEKAAPAPLAAPALTDPVVPAPVDGSAPEGEPSSPPPAPETAPVSP